MRTVYLASPIDSATTPDIQLRASLRNALLARHVTIFDPSQAWAGVSGDAARAVNTVNDSAIMAADCVLAMIGPGRTIGVPMEIQFALNHAIPVGVICGRAVTNHAALGGRGIEIFFRDREGCRAAAKWAASLPPRSKDGTAIALVQRDAEYTAGLDLPGQAKRGDIGCDLVVSRDFDIGPSQWLPVPNDISVLAPRGSFFLIMGRSSALVKRNLFVMPSVIDGGYTGRLYAMAQNLANQIAHIKRGERIAQLIPLPLTRVEFREVPELPATERGHTGFGSTGA